MQLSMGGMQQSMGGGSNTQPQWIEVDGRYYNLDQAIAVCPNIDPGGGLLTVEIIFPAPVGAIVLGGARGSGLIARIQREIFR